MATPRNVRALCDRLDRALDKEEAKHAKKVVKVSELGVHLFNIDHKKAEKAYYSLDDDMMEILPVSVIQYIESKVLS